MSFAVFMLIFAALLIKAFFNSFALDSTLNSISGKLQCMNKSISDIQEH